MAHSSINGFFFHCQVWLPGGIELDENWYDYSASIGGIWTFHQKLVNIELTETWDT